MPWSPRGGTRGIIRPYCAADGGAGGELRGRASLAAVTFQDTSDWPPFVLCAEPQTSREVDQDPEVGLTRQCNGTLCVPLYSFRFFTFYHKTTVAGDAAAAGGAGGAVRARASLVTVDVLTDGARQVRLACAEPQTYSGPGPGGRAPEAV